MKHPRKHDLKTFRKWLAGMRWPFTGDDRFVWGKEDDIDAAASDLVAFREHPQDDAFSRWVGETGSNLLRKIKYPAAIKTSKSSGVRLVYDKKLMRVTNAITTIIASILPSLSITVLYCIKSTWKRIVILAAFNILISVCLTAFTAARRSEVFAVSAAYVGFMNFKSCTRLRSQLIFAYSFAAVQVVFIGTNINENMH